MKNVTLTRPLYRIIFNRKFIFSLLLFVSSVTAIQAQRFEAELYFAVRFDNREYDMGDYSSPYSGSISRFGSKLTPLVGFSWSDHDRIMVGSNLMSEFGAKPFEIDPDFVAYYQWSNERIKVYGGVIPRFKMIGAYPRAMFSGTTMFYDRNVQGTMFQYKDVLGRFFEFGCDWNSKFGDERREKFMLFASGRWQQNWFFAGADLTMYHHAGTVQDDGVVDNMLVHPNIGVTFSWPTLRSRPSIMAKVGWLQALQNDREYVGEYVRPGGTLIDVTGSLYGFSITNTLYIGDNLMPYLAQYGEGLYYGDTFFSTQEGCYNRLEINYRTPLRKGRQLSVSSVHQFDGKGWGWQQLLTFSLMLDRNMLGK